MVVSVIAWPNLVLGSLDKGAVINVDDIKIEMPVDPDAEAKDAEQAEEEAKEDEEGKEGEEKAEEGKEEDPAAAVLRSLKK